MAAAAAAPAPDLVQQQRKLQILCLHGSRQDGEVFSQRLKTLRKKLASIADLHFVCAPHTLPLQEGQAVAMRAWWRHWNVLATEQPQLLAQQQQQQQQQLKEDDDQQQQQQQCSLPSSSSTAMQLEKQLSLPLQQQLSLPHGRERQDEVAEKMAAGWESVVLRDWGVSLSHLCDVWRAGPPHGMTEHASSSSSSISSASSSSASSSSGSAVMNNLQQQQQQRQHGGAIANSSSSSNLQNNNNRAADVSPFQEAEAAAASAAVRTTATATATEQQPLLEYDGVLGFSNGAAAAFLFAAHAAAHPEGFRSLRFVALAGGYVPEPLEKLLPAQLLLAAAGAAAATSGSRPTAPSSSSSSGSNNASSSNISACVSSSSVAGANSSSSSSSGGHGGGGGVAAAAAAGASPASRLCHLLPFPSLHMMGSNDPLMDVADSSQLMDCFQEQGRVQLVHDSGHAVPQQSRYMQEILKFVVKFAELPLPVGHHKHRLAARRQQQQQRQQQPAAAALLQRQPSAGPLHRLPPAAAAAAAAAGGGGGGAAAAEVLMEAQTAEIAAKLHRQGLKDKTRKGPAHKHPLIKLDSTGQPHQRLDLLSPKHPQQHPTTPRLAANGSSSSSRNSNVDQQQQQHLEAQRSVGQQVLEVAAAAAMKQGLQQSQQQQQLQQSQQQQQQQQQPEPAASEFGEATEIQLEELEALQAIFGREYHLVGHHPPTFTIKLREPDPLTAAADGDDDDDEEEKAGEGEGEGEDATGPPSRLFTLRFTLPKDYPLTPSALPVIAIEGPLGKNDPARAALANHLAAAAAQQQEELGGAGGYAWQLAAAAKEWIDATLPPDIGSRRAGVTAAAAAVGASTAVGASATGVDGSSTAAAAAGVPWWERDEVNFDLIAKATSEAAAAHWRSWAVADEDDPFSGGGGSSGSGDQDQQQQQQQQGDVAAAAAAAASGVVVGGFEGSRGRWDYTVGLVGKPSAGKSTFFNACTDPAREEDAAREAPFPFTTIAPNVGRGFIVLPDPAPLLGFSAETAQPAHGYALGFNPGKIKPGFNNIGPLLQLVQDCGWQQQQQQAANSSSSSGLLWRRVPVVVKDVAGLVPGAYQGRGRGNAFLNDLCDADVLVHVVDVSGTTDSEGAGAAAGEGADPRQEVIWVRQELHCWVFDNVRAKWPQVLRRPNRLPGLFSGYHAPSGLVAGVLRAVGVRLEDLAAEVAAMGNAGLQGGTKEVGGVTSSSSSSSSLASWGEWELHRLVAHFLTARFPILLALNKADLPSAPQHIKSVLQAYPHHAAVAVSAAAERQLQQLRRSGRVRYQDAAQTAAAVVAPAAASNGSSSSSSNENNSSSSSSNVRGSSSVSGMDDDSIRVVQQQVSQISEGVLQQYGSTGVLAALTCAVALKPPRWVFPIADREACTALAAVTSRAAAGGGGGSSSHSSHSRGSSHGSSSSSSSVAGALGWGGDAKARVAQGAAAGVLRDCVLLKPGSRVDDVYGVLKRPPYGLLEGEFVRAECRVLQPLLPQTAGSAAAAAAGAEGTTGAEGEQQQQQHAGPHQCRVVRKDELLGPSNCVLLLQTNRKVSWQGGAGGRRHH